MPAHCRMRGFDRDLIRGGHYGQRSCEPRKKAEHMAAPTKPAIVKKALANAEPSTHGTKLAIWNVRVSVAIGGKADMPRPSAPDAMQTSHILKKIFSFSRKRILH